MEKTKEKKIRKVEKKSNFEKKNWKKKEKKQKKIWKFLKKDKKKGKVKKKKSGKESLWITVVIHSEMCVGEQWFPPHHLDYVYIYIYIQLA